MFLVGCLVFTVVIVAGLMLIAATRAQHMDELSRLGKHARKMAEKKPLDEMESIFKTERDDYLSRLLSQAGLEARYDAMKTQWVCVAIGSGILLMAVSWASAPELSILGLILGLPIGAAGFIVYLQQLAKRYMDEVDDWRSPDKAGVADVVVDVIPPWEEEA